jgi:hypothetical protein
VIVAGYTDVAGQGSDIWVRKYDGAGQESWTATYNGSDNSDYGRGVAADSSDNVVASGHVFISGEWTNAWTRRYSPVGGVLWTQTYDGSAGDADGALAVATDSAGNVLVAGYTDQTGGDWSDAWVRKYGPAGNVLWEVFYNGPGGADDAGRGVATDSADNVIVVGHVTEAGQGRNIWVRKYNSAGTVVAWTLTVDGPASGEDMAHAVAIDGADNIVVAGSITVSGEGSNIWVRKYDPAGVTERWTVTAGGTGADVAAGVATDSADNVIVAGSMDVAGEGPDVWVGKYDPDGGELWTRSYSGPAHGSDGAHAVAVDGADNVVAAGYTTDAGQGWNAWVRKYLP